MVLTCTSFYRLKLKTFQKFDSAASALEEVASLIDGKVTPMLSRLLDSIKDEKKTSLAVADPKLGQAINKLPMLSITPISDSSTNELYRAIRDHLPSLIPGLLPENISTMSLGLSHSLSRHKLKFSPDKVDAMIIQAIALLDDLDKELNTYAMRVKEWYGWHFPEMGRIVNDNLAYSRVILKMGMRTSASTTDLADILPEEMESAVKAAAEVSMGTEITDEDLENIKLLAEQVVDFTEYRQQLSNYLSARMQAIAPNLMLLVGELVGARLIAHAGSLINLAKSPASTIQILGAEKALFRALKTKHDTPKYGLIYHASLVGQATGKNKGKIARMLAAKSAIGVRVDALSGPGAYSEDKGHEVSDEARSELGVKARAKIERYLRGLEGKSQLKGVAIGPNGKIPSTPGKWEVKQARKYNPDADGVVGDEMVSTFGENKEYDKDEEVEDASADQEPSISALEVENDGGAANGNDGSLDEHSDTLSTVSADSQDSPDSLAQETNWQSSIVGNSKEAKKARKVERHQRKLAKSEEKSTHALRKAKIERRLDRKGRRARKAEQVKRREQREELKLGNLARIAGTSIARYKRKLERGEIKFNPDGSPVVISKKEIKKEAKVRASSTVDGGEKRKRGEEGGKSDKKKKKTMD